MDELLRRTTELASAFLAGVGERPVALPVEVEALRQGLGAPLGEDPVDATTVIESLAAAVDPGLVATPGPRFFGFVIGGSLPAAVAADWLTTAWDQNTGLYAAAPAATIAEEVAAGWLLDVLGLPATASVGFVTGATMASFTGLAAARHAVLARAGWDVEAAGLVGAPRVRVLCSAERHATIDVALRYLGFGTATIEAVDVDDQGRMRADDLRRRLQQHTGPLIVCAQAGNVNTGSFDPLDEIVDVTHEHGGWVHVDGAFGLWAAASPRHRGLVAGLDRADSWTIDAHKWLNVPYDCGVAVVADRDAHIAAMTLTASYLVAAEHGEPDPYLFTPESSRRARGITVYAALRSLGRRGVADLVDRCCTHAARFAERLGSVAGVRVLNDIVLNQVLVRFGESDELTRDVIARVQRDGTCWLSGTTWQGLAAMRISVSNWSTSTDDVDRSVEAIVRCFRDARAR